MISCAFEIAMTWSMRVRFIKKLRRHWIARGLVARVLRVNIASSQAACASRVMPGDAPLINVVENL